MPKPRSRRRDVPPRKRRPWSSYLPPEVRVIGLVAIIVGIGAAIVLWPRKAARPAQELTVVVPAAGQMRLALMEVRRSFAQAHRGIDVVLVEARDDKMRAYEAMWRKGRSGVDLLIGAEGYLARWAQRGMLESWDGFLADSEARLAHAGLDAGVVAGKQALLPLLLELTCIYAAAPGGAAAPDSLAGLQRVAQRLSAPGQPALGASWQGPWAAAVVLSTAHAAGAHRSSERMLLGRAGDALTWWRSGVAAGWARDPAAGAQPVRQAQGRPVRQAQGRPVRQAQDKHGARLQWGGHEEQLVHRSAGALWLPPGAAERGTICLVYGAMLPRESRHKEAARLFVRELLSDQAQTALARRTGLLPAVVGAWKTSKGNWPSDWVSAAARSVALSPQLRSREAAQEFARIAVSCVSGETAPAAAAAQLARLSAGQERGDGSSRQD